MTGNPVLVLSEDQECMRSCLFYEMLIRVRERPTILICFGSSVFLIYTEFFKFMRWAQKWVSTTK